MKKIFSLLSLALVLLLSACAPGQSSRATGQVVDDAAITARVKTEIARTAGVGDAAKINVDTYRGNVALAGFIDTEQQAQSAVQAARKVSGVRNVINNLIVKSKLQ